MTVPGRGALALAHGVFNVVSGVWPMVHRRSFEAALGPKVDYWLVNTVAGLMVANGLAQMAGARTDAGQEAARRIGLGTASTLALIDLVYVPRGRISPAYLLDAAVEAGWVAAWLAARRDGSA